MNRKNRNRLLHRTGALALGIAATLGLSTPALADNARAELSALKVNRFNADQNVSNLPLARTSEGSARLQLERKKDRINYVLDFHDIQSGVIMAHIHWGNAWANGPVVVWLCETENFRGPQPAPQCPAGPDGVIEGSFDASDVLGPGGDIIGAGDLDMLVRAINQGAAYTLVHSNEFRPGEIRGQLSGNLKVR